MERDYYQVLGVGPDADEKEIKKAYRAIIRYCHPDSPDCRMTTDELFEVQAAYETLADPEKRARYDRGRGLGRPTHGRSPRTGAPRRPTRSSDPFAGEEIFSDLFSFFHDPFADFPFSGSGPATRIPERDLEITLTREEARRGGHFEVAIPGPGGIPIGTIVIRIAPNVHSGTEAVVDLSESLGVRQRVRVTIFVDDHRR
jgi:molecular chaperone DnaJ